MITDVLPTDESPTKTALKLGPCDFCAETERREGKFDPGLSKFVNACENEKCDDCRVVAL
jgi:hypothetical protein